jgi:alkylation response protein AidB-like acyl-CoA dehydrogenase
MQRVAFGKPLVNLGGNRDIIANARIDIDMARLLVMKTAWLLDTVGAMGAFSEVSQDQGRRAQYRLSHHRSGYAAARRHGTEQ